MLDYFLPPVDETTAAYWGAAVAAPWGVAIVVWLVTRRRRPRSMGVWGAIGGLVWTGAAVAAMAFRDRLAMADSTAYLAYRLLWILVPLALLAARGRVYPTRQLVLAALAPALISLGLFISDYVLLLVIVSDIVLAALAILDLASLPSADAFKAERRTLRVVSLRKPHPVTLVISNVSRAAYKLAVRDGVADELGAEPSEFALDLAARRAATLEYNLRASRRGAFALGPVALSVLSRRGFWRRLIDCECESRVHVYPDLKQLEEYAVLARTNRLVQVGVRRTRRVGQDNEFERLRDYTHDDNYKFIDWRSTARRGRLTVKDFQANQSQRLVFLVDCGRMMTPKAAGLSLLDHALNAVLMLSYVALSKGDAVGLIAFSDETHSFVPPRSGMKQMNQLLHATFDRFPRMVESRYDEAFFQLNTRCRKRSLVILITNVIDEVNANQIHRHLATLGGRHLPMGVLLRDRRLFAAADQESPSGEALFGAAAAANIASWRDTVLADLENKGVLSVDVFPEELTAPLVNRYLDIKARHLL